MHPKEWGFYKDVAYPLILEKKASLFVVYDEEQPIAITYSYHSDGTILDAITVFDIDYKKFNLGYVNNLKLIEWCLANNIKTLDFSKGYFHYKKRLGNLEYNFEYHIFYDSKSICASLIALFLIKYFELKQVLRDKKVNEKLHRITFWMRNKSNKNKSRLQYEFFNIEQGFKKEELTEVDLKSKNNDFLKPIIFDFLYLNNESFKNLKIHRVINDNTLFIIQIKPNNANSVLRILN